jgi:hypothetical protein
MCNDHYASKDRIITHKLNVTVESILFGRARVHFSARRWLFWMRIFLVFFDHSSLMPSSIAPGARPLPLSSKSFSIRFRDWSCHPMLCTVTVVKWAINAYINHYHRSVWSITVVARSKEWPSSPARTLGFWGIVGSNPTRGMDVCVRLFCVCVVLCVGRGLVTGSPRAKESYRLCID